MSSWDVIRRFDEAKLTLAHYRWTVLAAMGDFLDAGSIVAGAVLSPPSALTPLQPL